MTDTALTEYRCPNCRKLSNLTIWKSVNTYLNPELKPKVLDGSLFIFHCQGCHFQQEVAYAMLYHAQQEKYMIWWVPRDEKVKQDFNPRELEKIARMLPGYKLRLVPSLNRLREKIFIYNAGLDDRVLELLKRTVWATKLAFSGVDPSEIYFSSARNVEGNLAIDLFYFTEDGGSGHITASGMIGYELARGVLTDFGVPVVETNKWKIIDETYWDLAEKGEG